MVNIIDLKIENDEFSPKELKISQDDEIQIYISGYIPPGTTYTIYTDGFSRSISDSVKVRHKFKNSGRYLLKCKEHFWMETRIIVSKPLNQNDLLNTSEISNSSRKTQKSSKKKSEKNFVKKLRESHENVDEVFKLVLNLINPELDKEAIDKKINDFRVKIPEKYRLNIARFLETRPSEEVLSKLSKFEVVEKVLNVKLARVHVFTSSLSIEKVEEMLEGRWENT